MKYRDDISMITTWMISRESIIDCLEIIEQKIQLIDDGKSTN